MTFDYDGLPPPRLPDMRHAARPSGSTGRCVACGHVVVYGMCRCRYILLGEEA